MSSANREDFAAIAIRIDLEGQLFETLESWRRGHSKIPSRAQAVRQLLEQALALPVAPSTRTAKAEAHGR
jgi:hypothetical protein